MIKSEKGSFEIRGYLPELLADYAIITRGLYEQISSDLGCERAKQLLEKSFEAGFLSREEIKERNKDSIAKLLVLISKAKE